MAEVHWLRVYLSLEGPPPVIDRAAAQADAEALRRIVAIVGPGSVADELARRLEELEAALAVRPPSQRTTSELKEFVVFRLCDALAEAKRVPVALLQTGVTPDGVPPTLDTLLVHTALEELGLAPLSPDPCGS